MGLIETNESLETFGPEKSCTLTEAGAEMVFELRHALAEGEGAPENIEAWSPLPLEREPDAVEQAIGRSEELLERVRGDNGFAATEPATHKAIIWSLQSGLEALKARLPSREQLRALLYQPIQYLAKRFGDAAIGQLAKEAGKAVLRLLGLKD